MTSGEEQLDRDQSLLVAYLDGELSSDEIVAVEERLSREPELRKQLSHLEKTWDLLDELPSVEPSPSFTRSTLELVVDDELKSALRGQKKMWQWPLRAALFIAVPLCAGLSAYSITTWNQRAPVRQLVGEMPLLQNFECYEATGDIEFAVELHVRGIFRDRFAPQDASESSTSAKFVWDADFNDLETLAQKDKDDLRRKRDRFESLNGARREQFRKFHGVVKSREDRDELMDAMKQYSLFLLDLNEEDQNQLLAISDPVKRCELIEEIQLRLRGAPIAMSRSDQTIVLEWLDRFVDENEALILEKVDEVVKQNRKRTYIKNLAVHAQANMLFRYERAIAKEIISEEDFTGLYERLSAPAQRALDRERKYGKHIDAILSICPKRYVSKEKLWNYFLTLSSQQRAELEQLTGEKWREELYNLYYQHLREEKEKKRQ